MKFSMAVMMSLTEAKLGLGLSPTHSTTALPGG